MPWEVWIDQVLLKATNSPSDLNLLDDFSLVLGGPLLQFFVRSRLSTNALGWLKCRILFFVLLTWLPLLLLSTISGLA